MSATFWVRFWLCGVLTLGLVGCGGGEGGTPIVGGVPQEGTTSRAAVIEVIPSSSTLGDGSSTVQIQAIVKDAANVALAGVPVTWQASAGTLTSVSATTDTSGVASATFAAGDRSVGSATVTASSGAASGSTTVALSGARVLSIAASQSVVAVGASPIPVTVVVRDARNAAIAGASVAWATTTGVLTNQQAATNAQGLATALFAPGPTNASQAVVTVTSGGQSVGAVIAITGAANKLEVVPTASTLGDAPSATVTVRAIVKDASNVALANTPVVWEVSAGTLTDAAPRTDGSGVATAVFTATDRSAGTAIVTARAGNVSGATAIALSGARTVTVNAAKDSVSTDGETITVTAVVRDASNIALPGAAVAWNTSTGSLLNQTTFTDAQGVATATFSAGSSTDAKAIVTATSAGQSNATTVTIVRSARTIELLASDTAVDSSGEVVTLTATVKGPDNVAVSGAPVAWSASSGRLFAAQTTTNNSGVATAQFDPGADRSNRAVAVTARSGSATQNLTLPVVGTTIKVAGSTTTKVGTASTLTLTLSDAKVSGIAGAVLSVRSASGATVPATVTTDAAGQTTITYTPTLAGSDTLTIGGAGATTDIAITVAGLADELEFVSPSPASTATVGADLPVRVRYLQRGVPRAGVTVRWSATIGTPKTATSVTDEAGNAMTTFRSTFAGSSLIGAAVDVSGTTVRATLPVNFTASVADKLNLQLASTALPPNSTEAVPIVARVADANGNPVPGVQVNFTQEADPSGGRLQQPSAITDLNGVARNGYFSGPNSTPTDAVVLLAEVVPSAAGGGAGSDRARLTVNQTALFITLGTGNSISNYDEQTYEKRWTVYVTDANGVRVPNVTVTVKALPTRYAKGSLVWSDADSQWVYARASAEQWSLPACENEDGNGNGILNTGEDANNDGRLTPGNVVALTQSTVTTDANGSATIVLRYAELYAPWIELKLSATAVVAGTESVTSKTFRLERLASDFGEKKIAPPGQISPFGISESCSNSN